jgi:membrane protein required for colicin V production
MNSFDVVVAIILGFCLIRGIFRGLVKEMASIIGVLAGFYAAYTYYPEMAGLLSRWISNTVYLNITSFMVIFCLILIIISIMGVVLKYLMSIAHLGWVDRVSGAGFGILKGVLIASIMLVTLTAFLPKGSPLVRDSLLAPHINMLSENMAMIISDDMQKAFGEKMGELKRIWEKRS